MTATFSLVGRNSNTSEGSSPIKYYIYTECAENLHRKRREFWKPMRKTKKTQKTFAEMHYFHFPCFLQFPAFLGERGVTKTLNIGFLRPSLVVCLECTLWVFKLSESNHDKITTTMNLRWINDILKCMEACVKTKIAVLECTLPQKKHNFNLPIFPGAPSYLTLTQGHVML